MYVRACIYVDIFVGSQQAQQSRPADGMQALLSSATNGQQSCILSESWRCQLTVGADHGEGKVLPEIASKKRREAPFKK